MTPRFVRRSLAALAVFAVMVVVPVVRASVECTIGPPYSACAYCGCHGSHSCERNHQFLCGTGDDCEDLHTGSACRDWIYFPD